MQLTGLGFTKSLLEKQCEDISISPTKGLIESDADKNAKTEPSANTDVIIRRLSSDDDSDDVPKSVVRFKCRRCGIWFRNKRRRRLHHTKNPLHRPILI